MKVGDICLHVHHEIFAEPLTEPIENRIWYILEYKPVAEQALRLRMMGPPIIDEQVMADAAWLKAEAGLKKASAAWLKADDELQKAHAAWQKAYDELQKAEAVWQKAYEPHYRRLYPDSPWNGTTIFAGPFAELGSDS
jgi:hypothetical protein